MPLGSLTSCLVALTIVSSALCDGPDFDDGLDSQRTVRVRRQITTGGQVMKLKLTCPDDQLSPAMLTLVHDGQAYATARCSNGNFSFVKRDLARMELAMDLNSTHQGPEPRCRMWRHSLLTSTYSVIASFAPGTNTTAMFFDSNEENVMCNYDNIGHSFGNITRIQRPFIRPRDKPIYRGEWLRSKIDMEVLNVLDEPIGLSAISMSRLIRLRATIRSTIKGIYALSCTASNRAGASYQMIKGSCGDGVVFDQNDGFITHGNYTLSPFFKVFRLPGAFDLRFKCLFASCRMNDCDNKNSCPYARQPTTTPPLALPSLG